MEIQIEFTDSAGSYNKEFLRSAFPYFASLFDSGMSDARKTAYSLPMTRAIFECFFRFSEDEIKLESAAGILENIEDIKDGSEELAGSIGAAIMFLQIDDLILARMEELLEELSPVCIGTDERLELYEINTAQHFLKIRFFNHQILSLEKDKWNWRDDEIPNCIPNFKELPVPDVGIKYNLMKYFPECKLFVFFLPAEEVLFDDDIVFCFGLNKETESRTNRWHFQECGVNDVLDDEAKNSLYMFQLSSNALYECPLEVEEIATNKYKVTIKSGLSQKKIFIQNGYKRKGPWRQAEVSFEVDFELQD